MSMHPLARPALEPTPAPPEPERRQGERRGTRIQVIHFNGDRRQGDERRRAMRRGFHRIPLALWVSVRHAGVTRHFESSDVSVLGASLRRAPALPLSALVRVSFTLRDDLAEFPITTWAQVVSAPGAEAGTLRVRFVGLRSCDARRMGRYLAEHRRTGA